MSRLISSARSFSSSASDQGTAAVHLQLAARLGFQLADGSREVTGEEVVFAQRGSVGVVDARYLGLRVQGSCDLVVGRIFRRGASPSSRPVAGEELVGPPAEQERVGAL